MAYYNQGQYPPQSPPIQQSPPPPPSQGYHDPYNQYHQPVQNGGFPGQYAPQHSQQYYPGQQQYQPVGGAGQSPSAYQDGHHSPRSGSVAGGYNATSYQYNPAQYSPVPPPPPQQPHTQQPSIPTYNPQSYANVNSTPNPQQTSPVYGAPRFNSTSGPVNPWDYNPSPGGYDSRYSPSNNLSPQTSYGAPYGSQPPTPHSQGFQATSPVPPQVPPHSTQHYQPALGMPSPETYQPRHQTVSPASATAGINGRWSQSPAYISTDSPGVPSPLYPTSPPSSSTPGPTPPAHGVPPPLPDRHPTNRPLPSQPEDPGYFQQDLPYHSRDNSLGLTQDELFDDVEHAVMNAGRGSIPSARSPSISISHAPYSGIGQTPPLFSSQRDSQQSRNGHANGNLSPVRASRASDNRYGSDSDVEAAQGVEMMRAAEAEEHRRQSGGQAAFGGYGHQSEPRQHGAEAGSDSDDYANLDMTSFDGSYHVPMTYGGNPSQLAARGQSNGDISSQAVSSQHSSIRRSNPSQSSHGEYDYYMDSVHPFPPFTAPARVDAGGTGGLSEPTSEPLARRQSFDEGDEYSLMDGGGNLPDRFPDEPPDIGFHQASSTFRPLPAPPYADNNLNPPAFPDRSTSLHATDHKSLPPVPGQTQSQFPVAPDAYTINAQGQYVPRSTSLVSHSNTPPVVYPLRSKTDAEERRMRQPGYRNSGLSVIESTAANGSMLVDLPAIGKRFNASKLGAPDFKKCEEPWSLSSLLKWLLQVTNPEQNVELKEADVSEALVALFTSKVPTMNITDAEALSSRVVEDMYQASTLVKTEEWVKLVPGPISGVIFQLTQSGCYSPRVHDHLIPNMRCYSHLCQRTLKKVSLIAQAPRMVESWAEFYNLKKEDYEGRDKKELERQYVLHEIVTGEEGYMEALSTLQTLFRDTLATIEPSIIAPKRREKFIREVFGRLDAVKQAHEDHLLPQLKYRQQEQGPWIVGFSDIFRQWIRKAKTAYLDYANDLTMADFLVRQEMERNIEFRNFCERARTDKRSNRLSLDNFLKAPITRLQRYGLLILAVLKTMQTESPERTNLQLAHDEIKNVTVECDSRVDEMKKKIELVDLNTRLVIRPQLRNHVELNLDHFGRELIFRGELQRMGSNRFTFLDCHALLFDHYLVLSKIIVPPLEAGGRSDKYDVSRLPIPMDLLILESTNDPAVQKSSYMKGIATVTQVAGRTSTPTEQALGRTTSNQVPSPGGLAHANTGTSSNSLQTLNSLGDKDSDRILFPFRVKHLGRETYTLFALSEQSRLDWCKKIVEAKTKHATALHAQNAEPFRLRVMADSAFHMDAFGGAGKGVVIKGTPVDRAIKEVEHRYKDTGRPVPVCRARVNCATTFTTPHPSKQMVAVGTDYGVYVSELGDPRGWSRVITMTKVTQIAVLEEFNLFLLIAERSLIAYHLDVVCPTNRNGPALSNDSMRNAPQKLSGSRDVGFFVTGKMKERTLVFYKKKEGMNSVFKVLEPVYQKSTEKKRGFFKRGTTEFFREYDEFYIPAESTGMNLFHSSLAVSTARGFEVLTLDKKQPWSVPELKADHVQNIAAAIKDQKALSMLRLSDQEFLLCYERHAVYVNKHGDVSRSVIMDFVGSNAQAAALYGPYLVLFNDDFVEVRNAQNGRLKQIIAGREVKCLDDGTSWPAGANGANGSAAVPPRTLKLVMQHPEIEKTQIVVELLLNENMKE